MALGQDPAGSGDEQQPTAPWRAWVETAVITVAGPCLGYLLHPQDPWFVASSFSWLAFVPLFLGLRFGFAYGFGSALALLLGAGVAWQRGAIAQFPSTFGVGLLGVGMVAGEFCDLWRRRLSRLSAINEYRRIRLDEFTRSYQLLKVSHDRLEQVFAASDHNLREAIMTMNRGILGASRADGPLFGLEKRIVALFSNYTWVQVGSLFAVDERGRLITPALAQLGEPSPVDERDPLLAASLAQKKLLSVRAGTSLAERGTHLLAVIPLVDADGRVWGLFAIQSMLFIAFHDENLKLLAVIGAHIGDILAAGPEAVSQQGNAAARMFIRAIRRGIDDRRRFDLPVVLVGLRFPETVEGRGALGIITSQRRGLDQILQRTSRDGTEVAMVLLPLTSKQGFAGYVARINEQLQTRYGVGLEEAGIEVVVRQLEKTDEADDVLAQLRDRLEIDDTQRIEHPGA